MQYDLGNVIAAVVFRYGVSECGSRIVIRAGRGRALSAYRWLTVSPTVMTLFAEPWRAPGEYTLLRVRGALRAENRSSLPSAAPDSPGFSVSRSAKGALQFEGKFFLPRLLARPQYTRLCALIQ